MAVLPDWFDDTFIITILGLAGGCFTYLLTYFLKSRCTLVRCCCFQCERQVLEGADLANVEVVSTSAQ